MALDFPSSPSDGDTYSGYVWNSTVGAWQSAFSGNDLNDLNDVEINTPLNNQIILYEDGQWVNKEFESVALLKETTEKTENYTIAIEDLGKIVQMNKSGAATLTIPNNSSAEFPIGSVVGVYNRSSDAVTVSFAEGVTVRNAGSIAQYSEASIRKRGTNEWVMVGG